MREKFDKYCKLVAQREKSLNTDFRSKCNKIVISLRNVSFLAIVFLSGYSYFWNTYFVSNSSVLSRLS